jgi:hypothetical protein
MPAPDVKGNQIRPGTKNAHKNAVLFVAGEAVAKGDVMYVSATGARALTMKLASSAGPGTAVGQLYVAQTSASLGHESWCLPVCVLEDEDTSDGAVGDPVYLSTAGGWSLTPGAVARQIGHIAVNSETAGEIAFSGSLGDGAALKRDGITTVAMGDAAHALVIGTAGAGETQLTGNVVFVDAESGATETLTLPAEAGSAGLVLHIFNTGGESITVADDAAATVVTVATAEGAVVACDGTSWRGLVGANT